MKKRKTKAVQKVDLVLSLVFLHFSMLVFLWKANVIHWAETPSLRYGFYIPAVTRGIAEGDCVIIPVSEEIKSAYKSVTGKEMDCDNIIKRVKWIKGGKCYVSGDSSEQIEARTGVKGLRSFDSDFFGTVPVSECRKVYFALPLSSACMLGLIRLHEMVVE